MTKAEQTPERIIRMYDLTRKYTRSLQPYCYKQYRGDVDDLASRYFTVFMTEHGRRKKETLLDKYDPQFRPKSMTEEAYFSAFIKLCVRRLLGDSAKMDPIGRICSLDELQEKCGDAVAHSFDVALQDDSSVDTMDLSKLRSSMEARVATMSKTQLAGVRQYYNRVKNALNPEFKQVFGEVLKSR